MKSVFRPANALLLMLFCTTVRPGSSAPGPAVPVPVAEPAPPAPAPDAKPKRDPETIIADLEKRGRYIADYDHVAWVATDLMMEQKPDKSLLGTFFAMRLEDRWYVFFGKLHPEAEPPTFVAGYTFSAPADHPEKPEPVTGEPPEAMKQNFQKIIAAALALDASSAFVEEFAIAPSYNPYVYPEDDGSYTVYYMPGQKETGKIPLGGDFFIRISANGRRMLDKQKLHNSILYFEPKKMEKDNGSKIASSMHSHIVTPLPTETDVAAILIHPELIQLMIVSQEWISGVDAKGKIKVFGATKDLIGKDKDEKK